MKRFPLLVLFTLAIAACGQPGPLYLPAEPAQADAGQNPKKQQAKKPQPEPEETDPETESQTDQYYPY